LPVESPAFIGSGQIFGVPVLPVESPTNILTAEQFGSLVGPAESPGSITTKESWANPLLPVESPPSINSSEFWNKPILPVESPTFVFSSESWNSPLLPVEFNTSINTLESWNNALVSPKIISISSEETFYLAIIIGTYLSKQIWIFDSILSSESFGFLTAEANNLPRPLVTNLIVGGTAIITPGTSIYSNNYVTNIAGTSLIPDGGTAAILGSAITGFNSGGIVNFVHPSR
jgi:hypothetical protein